VYVINLPPVPEDEIAVWIRNHATLHHVDPSRSRPVQIAALKLDILFYQTSGWSRSDIPRVFTLAAWQCVS